MQSVAANRRVSILALSPRKGMVVFRGNVPGAVVDIDHWDIFSKMLVPSGRCPIFVALLFVGVSISPPLPVERFPNSFCI